MNGGEQAGTEVADAEILQAVAADRETIFELLARLVEAPTTLGNEEPGQDVMRDAFRDLLGIEPVDIPLDADALRASPLSSPFSWDVSGKANVVADMATAGEGGRSLALNGHVDVVGPAAESLWRVPPFRATREGDWLYGRGTGDMKAGLAAIVGAALGLKRLALRPLAPVQLQSVVEEECTGNGALQCVLSGLRPDAAVIPEPFPGSISTAQVGVLWFHVDVAGSPAHVGESGEGVNAIEAAYEILRSLRRLEIELNESPPAPFDTVAHPINLNAGVINGGDWPSTVPAECAVSCRIALYPGERVEAMKRRVEDAVADAASWSAYLAEHPPTVRYDGFACEGTIVADDEPVVQALSRAYERVSGKRAEPTVTTATTDARAFILSGIAAVCHGPHAEHIHGVDERVLLPSVIETAQTLALFVRDWCGVAG
jgi:acetylornithine deacetylase